MICTGCNREYQKVGDKIIITDEILDIQEEITPNLADYNCPILSRVCVRQIKGENTITTKGCVIASLDLRPETI